MYLSKIRVKNYKSFNDSGEIEFKPGINIIVGQNNSGKTTLLEALSFKFESKPHINLRNDTRRKLLKIGVEENELLSKVESKIIIPEDFIRNLTNEILWMPYIVGDPTKKNGQNYENFSLDNYELFIKDFLTLEVVHDGLNSKVFELKGSPLSETEGNLREIGNRLKGIKVLDNKTIIFVDELGNQPTKNTANSFSWKSSQTFLSGIYRFHATRICKGGCVTGTSIELKPDGENLAEVLSNIHGRYNFIYQKLNKYVSEIFPSVKWIDSPRTEAKNGQGPYHEIRVWTTNQNSRREDLAFPLSECGTGVGQVLAILSVVIISEEPRTIIIDEPNSFLHPGAAKKLIEILNKEEFSHHQYFISTHSPEIITASNPATITMLNYIDGETKVEQIDLSDANGVKKVFKNLGVEPATFAFANHILWVEGATEEKAVSLILKNAGINNVVVKPTVASAFRQSRKRKQNVSHIFKLHEAVSGTDSVISPKMTILLDREIGKESENEDLIREFGEDKFNFIPYAMYENYLLDAQAITHILEFTKTTEHYEEKSEETDVEVNVENVKNWIAENYKEFLSDKSKDLELDNSECLVKLDGAKLLDKLFKCFLGKPFGYEPYKVEYGEKLTQWLLENKPEQLAELKDFLINLISDKKSS